MIDPLMAAIQRSQIAFHPVLKFDADKDKLAALDLTAGADLPEGIGADTNKFVEYLDELRQQRNARFLIGGYNELRTMYGRSSLFDNGEEPRRLHIGVDIWGEAGTEVFAFWGGMVHSIGWNNQLGDYGATIILLHQLEGVPFYTLYGHLAARDIQAVSAGQYINRGQLIAHFGEPSENGQWPPHLHFQLIRDIGMYEGDFPGVVRESEREKWLANCPDPNPILQLNKFL